MSGESRIILELVEKLKERQKRTPTRACALAITKLEEAMHWLEDTRSDEPY